ncbi:MAG: hypothetical protein EOM37_10460 [Proteobacteria bacterium]|nr:hypothetical protein [Pseudomonadota bacterium]
MNINEIQNRKRGGQPGNKNALKHGFYTRDKLETRRMINQAIKDQWKEFNDNFGLLLPNNQQARTDEPENIPTENII